MNSQSMMTTGDAGQPLREGGGEVDLREKAPVPGPVPARRVAVDAGGALEAEAEQEREGIYHGLHTWRGRELEPFSISRRILWQRLCAVDVPLPVGFRFSAEPGAWSGHAVKLLYLCCHQPEEWRHLRADTPRFLEAIELWGEEHVPAETLEDAIVLGFRIVSEAEKLRAVARPDGRAARAGE